MKNNAHLLCLAVAAAGFLCLLRDLPVRRRDTASAFLSLVFMLSMLSFFFALTSTGRLLDQLLGTANLTVPLSQSCVLALLACQQVVLTHWGSPPDVAQAASKRWLAVGLAAITSLWLLFALFSPTVQRLADFTLYYAPDNGYAAYLTLYCTAYTVGELLLARACWNLANRSSRASVRVGLRVIVVGAVVTLGSSAVRLGHVIASNFDISFERWETIAWMCGDGGALLTLLGWLIPTLSDQGDRLRYWIRQHRSYHGLRPLWLTYYSQAPEIALPLDAADRRHFSGITIKLYRRTIEIHDGHLMISPYLDAEVREASEARHRVNGLVDDELAAAVTADQIKAAIIARAQDTRPEQTVELADASRQTGRIEDDFDALLAVARRLHPTATRTNRLAPVST
ncbi:MAB_1171c family putative transporter [Streptomyces sp. CA-294286]|uniref:MAB_1171c family putative transporter n=1 Tax=Streptomyces sp. CA-294286 TaxID=3240070 RepID=UPI003D8A6FE6